MTVNFASRARWAEYSPDALGWGGKYDPMLHPEWLTPFTFTTSRGETLRFGSMHKLAVPIFTEFYRRLDAKHPGVLHGDPDEGCFNPRSVTENGSRSFHTYAIATDTEWNNNPMGVGVRRHGDGALPDDTGDIGRPLGIQWGGTWTNFKDWMHNELHLSPADAIALAKALKPAPAPKNLLEEIMALDRNSSDYKTLVADIAKAVTDGVYGFKLTNEVKQNVPFSAFVKNDHLRLVQIQEALRAIAKAVK